jgi:GDP-L-fucose synthase
MERKSKIYIAGHRGLVGSAIEKKLRERGYSNLILKTHKELDLTRQQDVEDFFADEKPEFVFLSAARVGGIAANSRYPAEFIYNNIAIALNVIHSAYKAGVTKLLNLGSSCIFPKMAPQPLKEEYLLTGPLEITNEAYAIAKISAIRLCKHYNEQYKTNFISAMPANLYGPGDNYHPEDSHVLPAMIRKFHEAKENNTSVTLWGDGSPYREFLYSEDLAGALLFLMENVEAWEMNEFLNVGTGTDVTIKELSSIITSIVGYKGEVKWDTGRPNGTPRKLLDVSRLTALGWKAKTSLEDGIRSTYKDFLENYGNS